MKTQFKSILEFLKDYLKNNQIINSRQLLAIFLSSFPTFLCRSPTQCRDPETLSLSPSPSTPACRLQPLSTLPHPCLCSDRTLPWVSWASLGFSALRKKKKKRPRSFLGIENTSILILQLYVGGNGSISMTGSHHTFPTSFLPSLHGPRFLTWPSNGSVPRSSNVVTFSLLVLSWGNSHCLYKEVLITEHNLWSAIS